MKTVPLLVAALALLPVSTASARARHDCPTMSGSCCDAHTRWGPRHASQDGRLSITTQDGAATLVLTDRVVAVQLSDRCLRQVVRELRDREEDQEDANVLARAIVTVVFSSVRTMLDHSLECPVRELASADYRGGRLILTGVDGDRVFANIDVHDDDVLEGFAERDARAFVREFERVKARGR